MAAPKAQSSYYEENGYPVPDERIADTFHATCPSCGADLTLTVDSSSGPPSEVGTECDCGALPVWHVNWWYAIEVTDFVRDDAPPRVSAPVPAPVPEDASSPATMTDDDWAEIAALEANWDGQHADPIDWHAIAQARKSYAGLQIKPDEVGPYVGGEVRFIWHGRNHGNPTDLEIIIGRRGFTHAHITYTDGGTRVLGSRLVPVDEQSLLREVQQMRDAAAQLPQAEEA